MVFFNFWISATRFQSTPPVRGATLASALERAAAKISIHAPREGGDLVLAGVLLPLR